MSAFEVEKPPPQVIVVQYFFRVEKFVFIGCHRQNEDDIDSVCGAFHGPALLLRPSFWVLFAYLTYTRPYSPFW